MRLIRATSLEIHEFIGKQIPKYAILSHTWVDGEEIEFRHLRNLQIVNKSEHNGFYDGGFEKIRRACSRALKDDLSYLWVDTCCINKDSSAELSEAINSMYKWYRNSAVCYVYLSDVNRTECGKVVGVEAVEKSRWFTRGWTLQELLAPERLKFFDANWKCLGGLGKLMSDVCRATKIQRRHLDGREQASVAQKMSWMSERQTTREEDIAYCMLGLFNVNMPLLYGEGEEKAFLRLQQQIIQDSNDESIFAWRNDTLWSSGLLAHSPKEFAMSGTIRPEKHRLSPGLPYSMTNVGLKMGLAAIYIRSQDSWNRAADDGLDLVAPLACDDGSGRAFCLYFRIIRGPNKLGGSKQVTTAVRTRLGTLYPHDLSFSDRKVAEGSKIYFRDVRCLQSEGHRLIRIAAQWRPEHPPVLAQDPPVFTFVMAGKVPTILYYINLVNGKKTRIFHTEILTAGFRLTERSHAIYFYDTDFQQIVPFSWSMNFQTNKPEFGIVDLGDIEDHDDSRRTNMHMMLKPRLLSENRFTPKQGHWQPRLVPTPYGETFMCPYFGKALWVEVKEVDEAKKSWRILLDFAEADGL